MRFKLIACEILFRELSAAAARSANQVDVEFLPKGLHDIGGPNMSRRLDSALAAVDTTLYDAVLLGYGLCSNGLVGLTATEIPLVVPRAHDCITLFLGSRQRYLDYFHSHPGVFFRTSGWLERGTGLMQNVPGGENCATLSVEYRDLVARYGEDNARYLHEELCRMRNYGSITYIAMGVGPDERFEHQTQAEAVGRGWKYEKVAGDMGLLQGLLDGPWDDERYLVVPPGHRIAPSYDERVVKIVPVDEWPS
jgi:hypothetical protein